MKDHRKEEAVKRPFSDQVKGMLILLGAAVLLMFLVFVFQSRNDRLPKENGVTVYISFSADTNGKFFHPLDPGGHAYGQHSNHIWLSEKEYQNDADIYYYVSQKYYLPLNLWTYSPDLPMIRQFDADFEGNDLWFAVKTSGDAKVEEIVVYRWPLELAGTDAVKADTLTNREKVEYEWKDGGLFRLSKGNFRMENEYFYSFFVRWSSERQAGGWTEFSFITRKRWEQVQETP